MPWVSKPVFAAAEFLFDHCFPVYRASYFAYKRQKDADLIRLLRRVIGPGDTVLDIGANIGFYTEILAGLVGHAGRVHAFEPDPTNLAHLEQLCSALPNVVVNAAAVGSHVGEVRLFKSTLGNLDHRTYPSEDAAAQSFTVPVDTIDRYIAGAPVSLVKMDIQGAEYSALLGMARTLEQNRDVIVVTEFWPFALKEAGTSPEAVQGFLRERGLGIYRVGPNGLERMDDLVEYFHAPKAKYDDIELVFTRRRL